MANQRRNQRINSPTRQLQEAPYHQNLYQVQQSSTQNNVAIPTRNNKSHPLTMMKAMSGAKARYASYDNQNLKRELGINNNDNKNNNYDSINSDYLQQS